MNGVTSSLQRVSKHMTEKLILGLYWRKEWANVRLRHLYLENLYSKETGVKELIAGSQVDGYLEHRLDSSGTQMRAVELLWGRHFRGHTSMQPHLMLVIIICPMLDDRIYGIMIFLGFTRQPQLMKMER